MHILMPKVHIFVKIVKIREKIWVFEFPEPTVPPFRASGVKIRCQNGLSVPTKHLLVQFEWRLRIPGQVVAPVEGVEPIYRHPGCYHL